MSSYEEAGVNIDAGNESVELIKESVKKTYNAQVLTNLGAFAGVYSLSKISRMKNPLLVSTIDGVGTKLKIASQMNRFDTIGEDIVNHCSNDILALGASPLFFLDYIASDSIKPKIVNEIVSGMTKACQELGCALIGGETAEMPGVYEKKEHDIVGTMIGVVEKASLVDGSKIKEKDVLIGLPSNGLHTNGYSLARHALLEKGNQNLNDFHREFNSTLGEELLRPHKSYSKAVLALKKKIGVKGISHITGGGLTENVPRILSNGLGPKFDYKSIQVPEIFKLIQKYGEIKEKEMHRVFNMGVGLVLVVSKKDVKGTLEFLNKNNEDAWVLGEIVKEQKAPLDILEMV